MMWRWIQVHTLLHPLLICYAQMLINPGQLARNTQWGKNIYDIELLSQVLSSFRDSDFWILWISLNRVWVQVRIHIEFGLIVHSLTGSQQLDFIYLDHDGRRRRTQWPDWATRGDVNNPEQTLSCHHMLLEMEKDSLHTAPCVCRL